MAKFRVTYATLSADNEELHAAYEEGARTARSWVGQTIPAVVNGEARSDGDAFALTSPGDTGLELATVHAATEGDVEDAVAAARAAFPAWAGSPWKERVALLRRAAELISERSNELAALMTMEVGKNRLEALGDVEESADLIRYYCQQLEDNDGFDRKMGQLSANEHTRSVLKPYGVWAVISPFNFPMALAAGPAGGALVAGNTVVLKPSPQGSFTGYKLYECLRDAGLELATVHTASERDVDDAVTAARAAFPAWAGTPWKERVALLRRAADLISGRSNELAALMTMEVGKNRLEALGDVEEAADLIRYYCQQVEDNDGFDHKMGQLSADEHTRSVLKPYGVWAVISPFNFPMALAAGPAGGALVAGNTVVLKPSPQGSFTGYKLFECLRDAGLPAGAFHFLPGGDETGKLVVAHRGVDGITFTGSYEVGMKIYKQFSKRVPRPAVCEMGGKNPAIVSAKADLDLAAEGVLRSAFGFSGQKCSACSRVYVERSVANEFTGKLADRAARLKVGDPLDREVYMGPVIDAEAVERYRQAVKEARKEGRVLAGGEVLEGDRLPEGNYVAPTVVTDLPTDHRLFKEELFVPFVAVAPVDSLDEALKLANDTEYGLTAGFYSSDQAEIDRFLGEIEAGVVYVNRKAGATTGAWPGVQPFGGWKGSGSSGKAGGGRYYVQQFLREQSQTVIA